MVGAKDGDSREASGAVSEVSHSADDKRSRYSSEAKQEEPDGSGGGQRCA
jgi:hypothetical protein